MAVGNVCPARLRINTGYHGHSSWPVHSPHEPTDDELGEVEMPNAQWWGKVRFLVCKHCGGLYREDDDGSR